MFTKRRSAPTNTILPTEETIRLEDGQQVPWARPLTTSRLPATAYGFASDAPFNRSTRWRFA